MHSDSTAAANAVAPVRLQPLRIAVRVNISILILQLVLGNWETLTDLQVIK
jgi:hypothetical protein